MRTTTACLAVGVLLLALAAPSVGFAATRGGTLRVDSSLDFDYVDPAVSYFSNVWQLEHVTCEKLLGFSDREGQAGTRPVPQIAAAMPTVSLDGKEYTFRLRRGVRFSTGKEVTAQDFVYSWERAAIMQTNAKILMRVIAGFDAVYDKKAEHISGLSTQGKYVLRVRLSRVEPDFLSRMTAPFFCPLPEGTPLAAIGAPVPGTGPYYIKEWVPQRRALVVRNPYYRGTRSANVDAIEYTFGNTSTASRLRLEKGEADLGPIPAAAVGELVTQYGINKSRFFIRKNLVVWYLVLNHKRPLFANNTRLKQALSHAMDRPALVRPHGLLAGARTDQILPPSIPGYRDWNLYSLRSANWPRARELARGNLRDGKAVLYTFAGGFGPGVAQVVQFNAKQIGLEVEIRTFDRATQEAKFHTPDEPFDMGVEGWGADYPDPANFVNQLLSAKAIPPNGINHSYYDDAAFTRRMEAAALLTGDAREKAYSLLDRDLMAGPVPMIPYLNTNARVFVGPRVRNFRYHSVAGTLLNVVSVSGE